MGYFFSESEIFAMDMSIGPASFFVHHNPNKNRLITGIGDISKNFLVIKSYWIKRQMLS